MMRTSFVLFIGLMTIIVMGFLVIPADALKSEGNPLPETRSKKVCGDMLCSELESISDKAQDQTTSFDETMVFQQSIPGQVLQPQLSTAFRVMEKPLAIQSFFVQMAPANSDNIAVFKQFNPKEIVMAGKMGSFAKGVATANIFDTKNFFFAKSFSAKMPNDLRKTPLKFDVFPSIKVGKIQADSSILQEKLEKISTKPVQIQKPLQTDSKFVKMLEELKDKKLEIKKSK